MNNEKSELENQIEQWQNKYREIESSLLSERKFKDKMSNEYSLQSSELKTENEILKDEINKLKQAHTEALINNKNIVQSEEEISVLKNMINQLR